MIGSSRCTFWYPICPTILYPYSLHIHLSILSPFRYIQPFGRLILQHIFKAVEINTFEIYRGKQKIFYSHLISHDLRDCLFAGFWSALAIKLKVARQPVPRTSSSSTSRSWSWSPPTAVSSFVLCIMNERESLHCEYGYQNACFICQSPHALVEPQWLTSFQWRLALSSWSPTPISRP